jgi:hypothetical protein
MDYSEQPAPAKQLKTVHGTHPLNAEPDVAELCQHPITPVELHYARNHGI